MFYSHRPTRTRAVSQVSLPSAHSPKITLDVPKTRPTSVVTIQTGPQNRFATFSPTSSASATLRLFATANSCRSSSAPSTRQRSKSPLQHLWPAGCSQDLESPSEPSTPCTMDSSSFMSRTTSSFYASDDANTSSTALSEALPPKSPSVKLNPILASLEKNSKLCEQNICAACSKPGRDYPRCGKCKESWCSRECRLNGRKRHICSKK